MNTQNQTSDPILNIEHLKVNFYTQKGVVTAINNLSFQIEKGKTLAVVGESGCGKSVTSMCIMRLLSSPGKIVNGTITFEGKDLLRLSEKAMRALRGNRISMIFQEPMTSLNPVFTVGQQMNEVFFEHEKLSKKEATQRSIALLGMVGIPAPEKRIKSYPHQLSGGMRQRVMIAMALASPDPGLLIADEPTTALDVTIQAQILNLMRKLQKKIQMSLMLITHDMCVVSQMADTVAVMYAGRKVEEGNVYDIFERPLHPYTIGLLNSIPSNAKYRDAKYLEAIPGTVPNLLEIGEGCPFENRCSRAQDVCRRQFPEQQHFGYGHVAYCHFAGQ